MAHSKSLARTMEPGRFAECGVHLPQVGAPDKIVGFDPEIGQEHFTAALAMGGMVVAQEHIEVVGRTKTAEAFPDKLIEGRRSAHGVTFGRLIGTPNGDRSKPSVVHVALKPFNNPESAVNEMNGYTVLRKLGVPTFEPIGVFPAEKGSHFVGVTAKDATLLSLDRHKWVVGRAVDSEESMAQAERNNQQVKGISETLAYIHANGVFHPDGQVKNYASDASGKVGVIDPENIVIREIGDREADQLAWNDIEKLVKSLVLDSHDEGDKVFGVGMFSKLSLKTVRSSIEELIIHPYLAKLESMVEGASADQIEQIETLYDGLAAKFYDDEEWPQHFIDANKALTP